MQIALAPHRGNDPRLIEEIEIAKAALRKLLEDDD